MANIFPSAQDNLTFENAILDPSLGTADDTTDYGAQAWTNANTEYHQNTDLLAQMNESHNANRYIVERAKVEKARLEKLSSVARRDIYILQQRELEATFIAQRERERTGLIIITLYTSLLALLLLAMARTQRLPAQVAMWGAVGLGVLYVLALILWFVMTSQRRRDVWGKQRWALSPQLVHELQEAQQPSC